MDVPARTLGEPTADQFGLVARRVVHDDMDLKNGERTYLGPLERRVMFEVFDFGLHANPTEVDPGTEDHSGPDLRWKQRRSDHHEYQAACCCCDGCGHVGNARALSKRSIMSTALSPSAPVTPSRQTAIGVRLSNA